MKSWREEQILSNVEMQFIPVVHPSLCTSCGICAGICPVGCISMVEMGDGFSAVIDQSRCLVKCNACSNVCPSLNGWYTKTQVSEYKRIKYGHLCGPYINLYSGWSNDPVIRRSGASGGLATHIIKFLFENKEIDSAILVRSKKNASLDLESYLALNVNDIYRGSKSKYQLVPFGDSLREAIDKKVKRLAVVGLPCHIQAIYRAQEYGGFLKTRVAVKIAIFCGHNVTRDFLQFFIDKERLHKDQLKSVTYRQGDWYNSDYVVFETNDKIVRLPFRTSYLNSVWKGNLFSQKACAFCPDVVGESADISLGDAWLSDFVGNKEGASLCLTKTKKGQEIIDKLSKSGCLGLTKRPIEDLFAAQVAQFRFKKQMRYHRQKIAKILFIPFPKTGVFCKIPDSNPRRSSSGIKRFLKVILRCRLLSNVGALYYFISIRLFAKFQRLRIAKHIPIKLLKLHARIMGIIH